MQGRIDVGQWKGCLQRSPRRRQEGDEGRHEGRHESCDGRQSGQARREDKSGSRDRSDSNAGTRSGGEANASGREDRSGAGSRTIRSRHEAGRSPDSCRAKGCCAPGSGRAVEGCATSCGIGDSLERRTADREV